MPGGGGSTSTSQLVNTNTSTDMGPWKEQGPYLTQGFAQAGNLLNNTKPSYYPGFTTAQPNFWENRGLEDLARAGASYGAGNAMNTAANNTWLKTVQGGFLDPSSNPWLSKTFAAGADDVSRAYQTATAPSTDASYARFGRYGSPSYRLGVENNERSLGTTLNNLATQIYGGNYQAERDRMNNATGNVGNMISSNFIGPSMLLAAGQQRQALDQPNVTDAVNRWNVEKNPDAQWQQLAKYMSVVGSGNWGQQGTTSSQSQSYGTQAGGGGNPFAMGLGGLLSLGGLAGQLGWAPFATGAAGAAGAAGAGAAGGMGSIASLMGPLMAVSDVRAKEDIKPIGKTYDGQNLYAYRYKGDDRPQIGLMAQEVERRDPDAVVTHPSGLKMVDYGRALGWEAFG